jgi:hypothetical protein
MHGALGSPALDTDYLILLSLVLHWKLTMNFDSTKIIEKSIEKYVLLTLKLAVDAFLVFLIQLMYK